MRKLHFMNHDEKKQYHKLYNAEYKKQHDDPIICAICAGTYESYYNKKQHNNCNKHLRALNCNANTKNY